MGTSKHKNLTINLGASVNLHIRTFQARDQDEVFKIWSAGNTSAGRKRGSLELLIIVLGACVATGIVLSGLRRPGWQIALAMAAVGLSYWIYPVYQSRKKAAAYRAWAKKGDMGDIHSSWVQHRSRCFFVAEIGGQVVGGVGVHSRPRNWQDLPDASFYEKRVVRNTDAYAFRLFVSPKHRGRGVGSALLRAAEGFAKEKGARSMRADTGSKAAVGFFTAKSNGYSVVLEETRLQGSTRAVALQKAL